MCSILLVEDDLIQRSILKKMLEEFSTDIVHIYEADNMEPAFEILISTKIDIFLIDIDLKNSSGLALAKKIRNIHKYEFSWIIFLTANIEYIIQAFKQVHCYDYIIKPYNKNQICTAIKKIIINEKEGTSIDKSIFLNLKNNIIVSICVNIILFIEVQGRKCVFHTTNGDYIAYNISLKKILDSINYENIVQSHKAFAVNIEHIYKMEKLDIKLYAIYFKDYDKTALLGYKYKNGIIENFKKNKICIQ